MTTPLFWRGPMRFGGMNKTGLDINRFLDSEPDQGTTDVQQMAPRPIRKATSTSHRLDADLYDELRLIKWELRMPSMTAVMNEAMRLFRDANGDSLARARVSLGKEGVSSLLGAKED